MNRDMLIKLLNDEHRLDFDSRAGWFCNCDKEFDHSTEWAEHVADLIMLGFAT